MLQLPRFVALCIAGHCIMMNQPGMVLWVMLTFNGYLCPSETMRLLGRCLVASVPNMSTKWGLIVSDWFGGSQGKQESSTSQS